MHFFPHLYVTLSLEILSAVINTHLLKISFIFPLILGGQTHNIHKETTNCISFLNYLEKENL